MSLADANRNIASTDGRRASATQGHVAWREDGSDYVGKRVKRVFGRRVAGAQVVKWVPKEDNEGLALWHVRHDDGDEVSNDLTWDGMIRDWIIIDERRREGWRCDVLRVCGVR